MCIDSSIDEYDFATLLASAVHDMKNSLAMLLNSVSEASIQCNSECCPAKKQLLRIQHEGHRVSQDLIQLLALYRLNKQELSLNIEEYSVSDFLNEIVLENTEILALNGIKLELSCADDLIAYFDKNLVGGVINTVVHNAYQYTKDKVLVSARLCDDYLVISIKDNGPGYPEGMLNNQKGTQKSINVSTGSTGLGHYFARQVANLHTNNDKTGFTEISNTGINQGGCFSLFLP
jgi:signal transduction histidine kinase